LVELGNARGRFVTDLRPSLRACSFPLWNYDDSRVTIVIDGTPPSLKNHDGTSPTLLVVRLVPKARYVKARHVSAGLRPE